MDNLLFFRKLDAMRDEDYIKSFISYLISPVITGVKPCSIINIFNNTRNLLPLWHDISLQFTSNLELDYMPIEQYNDRETILIYDKSSVTNILKCQKIRSLLATYGYTDLDNTDIVLDYLYKRLKSNNFPHEAGVFLGIPLHDVEGFIKRSEPCLLSGYWKVYSEANYAKEIFELYDKSKDLVADCILNGNDIRSLSKNFTPPFLN
ncbi:hypothetical protein CSC2_50330 [Clostridium zeae]|uniref:DUF3793 family protein n=1 Tax=Clostridium zeae TaxID=2759022 RepID=A0ABQ1EI52_9CLOT|nr:DUF3793 family protein [Clostridium zeae]GFZ34507.1 hypothetical protein CSC2_50330 [Clostridium zeae]